MSVSICFSSLKGVPQVSSYRGAAAVVRIAVDASPWGLGGILIINGQVTQFFADCLSPHDVEMFGHIIGCAKGQQTWEALAMLVALRVWACWWQQERIRLEVTGDNVGVLSMVCKMRSSGVGSNKIARELALDLADGAFRPSLCEHTPGSANVLPDALSRKFQPGVHFCLPRELLSAAEVHLPTRNSSFYRAISP